MSITETRPLIEELRATYGPVFDEIGLGTLQGGFRRNEVGSRRHLAATELVQLLQSGQGGTAFRERSLLQLHRGLGRIQGSAVAADALLQAPHLDQGQFLPLGDLVVHVDIDFRGDPGQFTTDGHLVRRLQVAGGGDIPLDVPAPHGLGDKAVRLGLDRL